MKNEAYKASIEIKQILEEANVFVKKGLELPPVLISQINELEKLGRCIEAYTKETNDKKLIDEIGEIPRFELRAIYAWYDISQETRISLQRCIRSLYNVAQMGNNGGFKQDAPATLPHELNTDEAKAIFKRAIDTGFMDEKYKFIGTWYQAAYFAELAAKKLKLSMTRKQMQRQKTWFCPKVLKKPIC